MLKQLFIDSTDKTSIQLFRYVFVGGVAFVVDFLVLFSLTEYAGLHYLVSAAVAFLFGLMINYGLSRVWVFSQRVIANGYVEFGIFAGIGLIGLALNELLIWIFTEYSGFHYLASKALTAILVLVWNFSARKLVLFH
jgi:putative flippase GtrA